jgi:AcrR family transcriptional regulator
VVSPADWPALSTKRRIEQAALQLFAAKGFEATGIRDIADRAGLSTAALYHYMGSKDELLIDFMLVSMTQLTRVAREALGAADGPAAELATLVRAHVGFHTLDPQRSLVADDELRALSEDFFARVMNLRDGYERLWAGTLERGQRSGVFRFSDGRITRLALLEMCRSGPLVLRPGSAAAGPDRRCVHRSRSHHGRGQARQPAAAPRSAALPADQPRA